MAVANGKPGARPRLLHRRWRSLPAVALAAVEAGAGPRPPGRHPDPPDAKRPAAM